VPASIHVNDAGAFDLGGPEGDNGLSGKKLVVDAYGPRVPIGGGALSGKDFFKADRAGAIHARRLAKTVVLTGLTEEAIVQLAWYPGAASAQVLSIESGDGRELPVGNWEDLFDLSLAAAGECWSNRTTLVDIARYGHFTDPELPWEKVGFQGSC
ncbi:MAG: methionine adenosyltransferase domain-containing protein, partial [Candidatus Latescibacterota bacterium]